VGILIAKTAEYAMGKIPHAYRERSLNSVEVQSMMWCLSTENNWSDFLQKTSAAKCRELIANLIALLEVHGHDCWFQQLGATTHEVNLTVTNFARILPRSYSFSKRLAYSISDLISPDCCLGAEEGGKGVLK